MKIRKLDIDNIEHSFELGYKKAISDIEFLILEKYILSECDIGWKVKKEGSYEVWYGKTLLELIKKLK